MTTGRPSFAQRFLAATLCVSLAAGTVLAQKKKHGKGEPKEAPSASAAPAPPPPPPGPPPLSETLQGDAKGEYEAGKILYGDGDNAGALLKFKRAHELSNDPRLLWNMAVVEKNLRHYTKVMKLVDRYLKEGGTLITDQDKSDADSLLRTVKSLVGAVKLTVNEEGAAVFLDDEEIGKSPLAEPIQADMGPRKIRVTKPGFKDFATTQQVVGGSEGALDVKLEKEVHEGRLVVTAGPKDAIAIDGQAAGVGRWEGKLASGGHGVRVTGEGKRPYQTEVAIGDNETKNVQVTLEAEVKPSGGGGAFWWIAGGVVVAGAAVGGYFLLKPKEEKTEPVAGTIPPGTVQLPFFRGR